MPIPKRFNFDLPISDGTEDEIKARYPDLAWILLDRELRKRFEGSTECAGFDNIANRAKKRALRLGILSILLSAAAIMIAACDVLFLEAGVGFVVFHKVLGFIAAVLGIFGGCLGFFGILRGRRKSEWLRHRVLTERIRQLYFQFIVKYANHIASSDSEGERRKILQARAYAWQSFDRQHQDWSEGTFRELIADEEEKELWLVEAPVPLVRPAAFNRLKVLLEFYKLQRINEQRNYASHVLRPGVGIDLKAPKQQLKIIENVTFVSVIAIFLIHFFVAILAALGVDKGQFGMIAHVIVVWVAIAALTAKTFEAGLRPDRDLERMKDYKLKVDGVYSAYDNAIGPQECLAAAHEMERTAYNEFRKFLMDHYTSRFSL